MDSLANCIDTGAIHSNLTAIKTKQSDININLGTINTITASQIAHVNLVTNVTTGTVTATIDGNIAELDDLSANASQAGTCAFTITVADAVTVTTGKSVVDATSATAITFTTGISDTLANCIDNDAIHGDLTAIKTKHSDINIALSTINTITASQITHLNLVTDITNGTVTTTIDGNIAELDDLSSNTDQTGTCALTITVADAASVTQGKTVVDATTVGTVAFTTGLTGDLSTYIASGANTIHADFTAIHGKDNDINIAINEDTSMTADKVTQLNAITALTDGVVTMTMTGSADVMNNLTGSNNIDELTITVNSAVTVAQGAKIAGATKNTTVAFSGGINDSIANLTKVNNSISDNLNTIIAKDADVEVTVNDSDIGGANVGKLNSVAAATDGIVTGSISGTEEQLDDLTTLSTDPISITVTGTAVSIAEFNTLNGLTSEVPSLSCGISDTIANISPNGTNSTGFTAAFGKLASVVVEITGTNPTITELNKVAASTTGAVTATISNSKTELADLATANTDAITITVSSEAMTVAEVGTLAGKTSISPIDLSAAGISDTLANMINADQATAKADLTTTLTADPNVAVVVGTISNASAENIADYNKLVELVKAGSGTVTGTLSGTLAILDDLAAASGALTIEITDTLVGTNVTALNTVKSSTSGTVTATISGSKTELSALTTDSNDPLTITVSSIAMNVDEVTTLVGKTSASTIDLSAAGVSDALSNMINAGAASAKANLTTTLTADPNLEITVDQIDGVTAANITDFNKLRELIIAGSGTIKGDLIGTSAVLSNLSSTNDDVITITIKDTLNSSLAATVLSGIGSKSGGVVTVPETNKLVITGSPAEIDAALVTDTSLVVAATSAVTISGAPTITQINNAASKTSGVVTASRTDTAANLDTLSTTSTDALTLTINDANDVEINATVLTSISSKTSGTVTASNAIIIKGTTAEVKAALVTEATKIIATSSKPEISDNPSVADINLIVDECGVVTATMAEASVASFADLDTGATDLITITLNDAAFDAADPQTIAATALSAIGGKTAATATVSNAVKIQGTVAQVKVALVDTDTLVVATPSLVNITGGDVALADITNLNNVAEKCDELTATLAAGSAATIDGLSTSGAKDTITITINDDAYNAVSNDVTVAATLLSSIGSKTKGVATVSNAIKISGTAAEVTAALVTDNSLVVAGSALVNITDNPTIAQLNAIAAKTSGIVTATLASTSSTDLEALSTTSTDIITIPVSDKSTVSQAATLAGKTAGNITFTLIEDSFDNLTDAPALNADLTAVYANGGADAVAVTITGTVADMSANDVTALNLVTAGTTGTVTATIDGNAAQLKTITTSSGAFTITVDDAPNTADAATITEVTSVATVNFAAGINDSASNLFQSGDYTNLNKVVGKDADVAIEINDDAFATSNNTLNATTISGIGGKTTGAVTTTNTLNISGSLTEVEAAAVTESTKITLGAATITVTPAVDGTTTNIPILNNISGATTGAVTATLNSATVSVLTNETTGVSTKSGDLITMTVSDTVTAAQGSSLAGKTSASITFSQGVTDTAANLTDNDGISTELTNITNNSGADNINITVGDGDGTVTAAQGAAIVGVIGTGTMTITDGVSDTSTNLIANTFSNITTIVGKTSDIKITQASGTMNIANGATLADKTTGTVTFTGGISDLAGNINDTNLAKIQAEDGDFGITITSTINVSEGTTVAGRTTGTVVFSGGLSDTSDNLKASSFDGVTTIKTEDGDINITQASGTLTIDEGNTLAGLTTGTIFYTGGISDVAANVDSTKLQTIQTEDSDFDITITDQINLATAKIVAGKTIGTIQFTLGLKDTISNLKAGTTNYADLDTVVGKDSDVKIEITDSVNVEDGSTVSGKTSGNVTFTGGVSDTHENMINEAAIATNLATILADGGADAVNITISDTVDDITDNEVTAINLIGNSTTGTFTITLDGNNAQLANLTANASQSATCEYTITVDDKVSLSQAVVICGKTSTDIDFAGKVEDSLANYAAGTYGNLETVVGKDSDVQLNISDAAFNSDTNNVTVNPTVLSTIGGKTTGIVTVNNAVKIQGNESDITGALVTADTLVVATAALVVINDTPTIAELNAISPKVAETTATIAAAAAATVDTLSTKGTDKITITINDADDTSIAATLLSSIGGKTAATATVSNAIVITGSPTEVVAAVVTDSTKVVASTAKPTISGTPTVSQVNNIAAVTGDVTATVGDSASNIASLTTSSTDVITITINDIAYDSENNDVTVAATDLSTAGGSTSATVTVTNAIKIAGTTAEVTAALVTADTLVVAETALVDISDNPTIAQLNAIAAKTSGVVKATLASTSIGDLTDTTNGLSTASTDDITIPVSDAATAAQGANIAGKTAGNITFSQGIVDTHDNLINGAALNDNLTAVYGNGGADAVNVTISGTIDDITADEVTAVNLIAAGTTGTVEATIDGNIDELDGLAATGTAATCAFTITVDDTATLAKSKLVVAATTGSVTYSAKITDSVANLKAGTDFADLITVTTKTSDVAIDINDDAFATSNSTINATDLSTIGSKTTGTVTVSNAIKITGTLAECEAALKTDISKVVASTAIVNISDAPITSSDANVTSLNDVAGATNGVVTATFASSTIARLANLTTANTDVITLTVSDSVTVTQGSTLVGKTAGNVTFAGVKDAHNNMITSAEISTNLSNILANGGADALIITVDGAIDDITADEVTALNLITDATTGTVTASIDGNTAQLKTLSANSDQTATCNFTITVDDKPNLADAQTILATTSKTTYQITNGVEDTYANIYQDGNYTNLNAVKVGDSDVAITVSDAVSVDAGKTVAESTTGTVTISAVTDTVANLLNGDAIHSDFKVITDEAGCDNINLTINTGATINIAQANALLAVIGTGSFTVTDGISDTSANILQRDNSNVAQFTNINTIVAKTNDIKITQASGTMTIDEGNTLAGKTTGTITYTGGISDEVANIDATKLGNIQSEDADFGITITDAITVVNALAVIAKTSGTVSFTAGISDTTAQLKSGGTTFANIDTIVAKDADVTIVQASGTFTINEANTLAGKTTGTVTLTGGISDTNDNIDSTKLTAIENKDDDVTITITDTMTVANSKIVADATTGTIAFTGTPAISDDIAGYNAGTTVFADITAIAARDGDMKLTVTDAVTAAQGATIADLTTGTVIFSGGVSDTLANLTQLNESNEPQYTNLNKIVAEDGDVVITISDAAAGAALEASHLSGVGEKTTGTVTLTNARAISGTETEVIAAIDTAATLVVLGGTSAVTMTGTSSIANVNTIAGKTTVGVVTADVGSDTFSNLSNLTTASTDVINMTISDSAGVAEVDALDGKTAGTISLAAGSTISDTIDNLVTDGAAHTIITSNSTLNITLTNATITSATNLELIRAASTGQITCAQLTSTAAVFANLSAGNDKLGLIVTDAASVSQAMTMILAVSSTTAITFQGGIEDTVTNLKTPTAGGNNFDKLDSIVLNDSDVVITISDDAFATSNTAITATDLSTIGDKTTGTVTVTNAIKITGSSSEVTAALITADTLVVAATALVTLSDATDTSLAATVLSAIGAKTSGEVTVSNAIIITGSNTQVTAALVTDDTLVVAATAKVTISDAADTSIEATVLSAIGGKTSGEVTVSNAIVITGTNTEVTAALVTANTLVVAATAKVTISDDADTSISATVLSDIGGKTSGEVTVSNAIVITGTVAQVTAALVTADTLVVAATAKATISDAQGTDIDATDLSAIGGKTSGEITVSNAIDISGDHDEVKAALVTDATKVVAATATVTISGTLSSATEVSTLASIAGATTGKVTATVSGTAEVVDDIGTTSSTDTISITVSDEVTVAQGNTIVTGTDASTVTFTSGIEDILSNLVNANNATNATTTGIIQKDTDITITISDNVGTTESPIDQNKIDSLNSMRLSTSGSLVATLFGNISVLKNLSNGKIGDYTYNVLDAASISDLEDIDGKTNITTYNITGGISDSSENIFDTNAVKAAVSTLVSRDLDVGITITGTLNTTQVNAVLAITDYTGNLTTNLSGSNSDLNSLNSSTADTINITVTDGVSIANITTLETKTAGTLTFSSGIADTLANLAPSGTVNSNISGSVTVTVSGTLSTATNVTHLDAVRAATTGSVTATLDGTLAILKELDAGTDALAITISDTLSPASAQNITDINTVKASTGGVVTIASIDGTAAVLDDLDTDTSDELTITVNDTATVAQGKAIINATKATTVDFSAAGITDDLSNLRDGSAIHEDLTAIKNKDSDIIVNVNTVTVTASAEVSAINSIVSSLSGSNRLQGSVTGTLALLDDLNAHAGVNNLDLTVSDATIPSGSISNLNTVMAGTTGTVTATMASMSSSNLLSLSTSSNILAITINNSNATIGDLSNIGNRTQGQITFATANTFNADTLFSAATGDGSTNQTTEFSNIVSKINVFGASGNNKAPGILFSTGIKITINHTDNSNLIQYFGQLNANQKTYIQNFFGSANITLNEI